MADVRTLAPQGMPAGDPPACDCCGLVALLWPHDGQRWCCDCIASTRQPATPERTAHGRRRTALTGRPAA